MAECGESIVALVGLGILFFVVPSIRGRAKWKCKYCGDLRYGKSYPDPGNSCSKNPFGKFHDWIEL